MWWCVVYIGDACASFARYTYCMRDKLVSEYNMTEPISLHGKQSHSIRNVCPRTLHRIDVRITIFSKFFSQLPHGTCSLSHSDICKCADELYHLIALKSKRAWLAPCAPGIISRAETGLSPSFAQHYNNIKCTFQLAWHFHDKSLMLTTV